jgi:hypothetical protein
MQDLKFAEFRELFIELQHYFGPLPNEVAMQRPHPQGFGGLNHDLIV